MGWFTRYILCRICRKLVQQGPEHEWRITEYYRIMHEAAKKEFTDETDPSLNAFLSECHTNSTS